MSVKLAGSGIARNTHLASSVATNMVWFTLAIALALSFGVWWGFLRPRSARSAQLNHGEQHVTITVKGGYSPDHIEAQAGVPLRLTFDRQETGECSSEIVFSDFGVSKELPAYQQTDVVITPKHAGDYGFACGMNMLHGSLHVVDNPNRHANVSADSHVPTGHDNASSGNVATLTREHGQTETFEVTNERISTVT